MIEIAFRELHAAVVVDTETTGLDPQAGDRLVSVAALHVRFPDRSVTREMYKVVNPQRDIPAEATAVNGLTSSDVSDKDPFARIAQDLRDFIGESPIIAHNVSFDLRFLEEEFRRADVNSLAQNRRLCTMLRFQRVIGQQQGSRLEDAIRYYGIPQEPLHHAYNDAMMAFHLAEVFYGLDNVTI